jgi:hypothetical protein
VKHREIRLDRGSGASLSWRQLSHTLFCSSRPKATRILSMLPCSMLFKQPGEAGNRGGTLGSIDTLSGLRFFGDRLRMGIDRFS